MDGAIGSTSQIGSTPYVPRCASMNATITALGGRAPPVRKRGRLLQNLVRAAQLEILPLEMLQLLRSLVVSPAPRPGVPFRLSHPAAQRLGEQPIFSAIDRIDPHCDPGSAPRSNTIRTARSLTSGVNRDRLVCFVIAPTSQGKEPPTIPGRFTHTAAWSLSSVGVLSISTRRAASGDSAASISRNVSLKPHTQPSDFGENSLSIA